MYQKIRITIVSCVVMILCIAGSTATVSYFTDSDAALNSFSIGKAETTLQIYRDAAGTELFDEDDFDENNPLQAGMSVPFYLKATNSGNIDVYQRFRIVIPVALQDVVSVKLNLGECNINTAVATDTCSNDDYTITYHRSVSVNDTPTYTEYYVTSNNILAKGTSTATWPTLALLINTNTSASELSLLTCGQNTSETCKLGIRTYSDAIQAYGFDTAAAAFANFSETY